MSSRGLSRRSFLKSSATGGVALLSSAAGVSMLQRRASGSSWMLPDTTTETPNQHQIDTLRAMADTFLPN